MPAPLLLTPADLDYLHDSPVIELTFRIGPPKELALIVDVRNDAEGPIMPVRGKRVRVLFRDVFFIRLTGFGGILNGEDFGGCSTGLDAVSEEHCRQMAAAGLAVPPVWCWLGERHGSWWLFCRRDGRMSVGPKFPPAGAV